MAAALAAVACNSGDRNRLSNAADSAGGAMRASADSAGGSLASRADSAMGDNRGGDAGTGMASADTAMAGADRSGTDTGATGRRPGPTGARAMGGVGEQAMTVHLSSDQVRQLQTALNDAGCRAGPVDGFVGAQTRRAIGCAMRKNNIETTDMNGLYRSLNLDFGN